MLIGFEIDDMPLPPIPGGLNSIELLTDALAPAGPTLCYDDIDVGVEAILLGTLN